MLRQRVNCLTGFPLQCTFDGAGASSAGHLSTAKSHSVISEPGIKLEPVAFTHLNIKFVDVFLGGSGGGGALWTVRSATRPRIALDVAVTTHLVDRFSRLWA